MLLNYKVVILVDSNLVFIAENEGFAEIYANITVNLKLGFLTKY